MSAKQPEPICLAAQVPELGKFCFAVNYRGSRCDAILVRFRGKVYGYLNLCVHMSKPLDCEDSQIFDKSGRYLQCSVHGICYDPVGGKCLNEVCAGGKLTALQIREEGGRIYLEDKEAVMAAMP